MIKIALMVALGLALSVWAVPIASAQDMILNGNYELEALGPWIMTGGNTHTSVVKNDVTGTGNDSWCLEREPGTPNDNGGITQDVLLIGGVTYDFYADIKYNSC